MKGPILVVLAAGMGSRYGGLKQIDRIGGHGEVLLDFSVYDALRSGFKKIVFIIRRDMEQDFKEIVLDRMGSNIEYELAYQELDSLIPDDIVNIAKLSGRSKPWGTTHALLCAKENIDAPFAVLNADDFYGVEAFNAMGAYLQKPNITDGAIVPYNVEQTLSPQGTVTRGVCEIKDGLLTSVDELFSIRKDGDGKIYNTFPDGTKRELPLGTPVSMNFWGFPPAVLAAFKTYFDSFLAESGKELKSECYIPRAVDWFIKTKRINIRSLPAASEWFGITYKEDKGMAIDHINALVKQGVYPSPLWRFH
ncbi:nucleotidyltransferase [Spirochaetia bacterium]|nr:nucleotidyltransferase [Spirochaetia bacterium]